MKKWLPPLAALVIFVVLLVIFLAVSSSSKPPQVEVLAAAHPLHPGDVLTAADLQTVKVYKDARAEAYIPASRQSDVIGGVVLQPFNSGEPITKLGVASPGTAETRLAGLLTKFPGMAIFPLPLDLNNVVSPQIDEFHEGDIVSLTVVYTDRPSLPENPATAYQEQSGLMLGGATPAPLAVTPTPTPSWTDYTERGKPPVAKTFETGYRVVAVLGKQEEQAETEKSTEDNASPYVLANRPPRPILMLLVPQKDIEPLSLAVTQGHVFVSLALKVSPPPGGFSYWDFEQMLKEERERLQQSKQKPSAKSSPPKHTPTPAPKAKPTAKP